MEGMAYAKAQRQEKARQAGNTVVVWSETVWYR